MILLIGFFVIIMLFTSFFVLSSIKAPSLQSTNKQNFHQNLAQMISKLHQANDGFHESLTKNAQAYWELKSNMYDLKLQFPRDVPMKRDPKILFLVRTWPPNYDTRLKWQSETWMSVLPQNQMLIVALNASYQEDRGNPKRINLPGLKNADIIYPECRNKAGNVNKGMGLCCQEAEGLVRALDHKFDWLFIIDDDIFLVPKNLTKELRQYNPNYWDLLGQWGCGAESDYDKVPGHRYVGFCGGYGYAISRKALERLVGEDDSFLVRYRDACEKMHACDVVTGALAKERDLRIKTVVFGLPRKKYVVFHKPLEFEMYRYHAMLISETEPLNETFMSIEHWKLVTE